MNGKLSWKLISFEFYSILLHSDVFFLEINKKKGLHFNNAIPAVMARTERREK
jgi:hypothetical protein